MKERQRDRKKDDNIKQTNKYIYIYCTFNDANL